MDDNSRWLLEERIHYLTKRKEQSYCQYLEVILGHASKIPELILIKLIDRFDNTYDLRLDITDEGEKAHFYTIIFDTVFAKSSKGPAFSFPHPMTSEINGAKRLFQLYKNIMFLSLIRAYKLNLDDTANKLFKSLIVASSEESQNIILHIFSYHLCQPSEQKKLLQEILVIVLGNMNEHSVIHELNKTAGLFHDGLSHADKAAFNLKINALYENKKLMCQTALVFLIIFSNFFNDPDFSIRGDCNMLEILKIRDVGQRQNAYQPFNISDSYPVSLGP